MVPAVVGVLAPGHRADGRLQGQKSRLRTHRTGAYLWWERYASGWTFKRDEWRYYLYRAHAYPYHWLLRRGYDDEDVLVQGVESYREFVAQCEEYVNERNGQCSLWEVST